MEVIRLLQMSDIHWTKQPNAADDYTDIRNSMIEDLENYCQETGNKFDKILLCGDIAFSGSKDEYERANIFINELCTKIDCKPDEVYTVPGNHDKNVNEHPKCIREFIHTSLCNHGTHIDKLWLNMITEDFTFIKKLYTPFKEYNEFCNNERDCAEPFMLSALDEDKEQYDNSQMYWCYEFDEELNGYKINLYGVNSALTSDLQDYDTDPKRQNGHLLYLPMLAYHEAQIHDGVINILMCHHPLDFLLNRESIEKDLDRRYALQLYGHVHLAESNMVNNAVHVYSGALNPGDINDDTYQPVYNIIELSIDKHEDGEDILNINLQVRIYNGEFFDEDKKQSKRFCVVLKNRNTWQRKANVQSVNQEDWPDGVTKRDIRHKFIKHPQCKIIIKQLYPDMDCDGSAYIRNQAFLNKIRTDNKWLELYNIMLNE